MTDLALISVIAILIVQNAVDKYFFLKHIKSLEMKLLTGDPTAEPQKKTVQPNEVEEIPYRDIADIDISAIARDIKQKLTK